MPVERQQIWGHRIYHKNSFYTLRIPTIPCEIHLQIDLLVPLSEFHDGHLANKPNAVIKHKLNQRKRHLKHFKNRPSIDLRSRIRNLNCEIRKHFYFEKRNNVRRYIVPGNCKWLWNAVNASKDNGTNPIPNCMTRGGVPVCEHGRPESFALFFEGKVKQITESSQGTVVLGVNTRLVFTWMRKVVGSNPGEVLYRCFVFFCGRRLKKGDCFEIELERQQCDEKQEVVRINLLRLAYHLIKNINVILYFVYIYEREYRS